jgi:E3 ubiquitin-protein ligase HUWE1
MHILAFHGSLHHLSKTPSSKTVDHFADMMSCNAMRQSFLAELPEELRAELMQQQQQQQTAMQLAATASNAIDPEFLAALPPDIQADVLRQHQRAQEAAEQAPADQSLSQDMDNASFIATLSPELREEVLLTADDAFLASLPPHLAAEAALLRERAGEYSWNRYGQFGGMPRSTNARAPAPPQPSRAAAAAAAGEGAASRMSGPAAVAKPKQVIEEGKVASIVRLVFMAQPISKNLMHRMLSHLCAHEPTRVRAVRMLLTAIVHADNPAEAIQLLYGSASPATTEGITPSLISRRALEALSHVASLHPSVCELMMQSGFLEAHRDGADSKGKRAAQPQNEELAQATAFELLIRQLSTPLYLKSASHLEQLALLLNSALTSIFVPGPAGEQARQQQSAHADASGAESTAAAASRSTAESAEAGAATSAAAAEGSVHVSAGAASSSAAPSTIAESKMPRVSEESLNSLTQVIAHTSTPPKAIDRLTALLKGLCTSKTNVRACIKHVIREVHSVAQTAFSTLRKLSEMIAAGDSDPQTGLGYDDLKLLRLVRTLKTLWPEKQTDSQTQASDAAGPSSSKKDVLEFELLAEAVNQEELWELLGSCLTMLEGVGEASPKAAKPGTALSPGLSRLQPLVEAFLVVNAPDAPPAQAQAQQPPQQAASTHSPLASPTAQQQPARTRDSSADGAASTEPTNAHTDKFVLFAERHRTTINMYIRQDKSLLNSPSFAPLVRFPKLLDFDNKKYYFRELFWPRI